MAAENQKPQAKRVKVELYDKQNIPGHGINQKYVWGTLENGRIRLETPTHPEFEYVLIPLEQTNWVGIYRDGAKEAK